MKPHHRACYGDAGQSIDHEGFAGCIGGNLISSWVGALDGHDDGGRSAATRVRLPHEFWVLDVEVTSLPITAERFPDLLSSDVAEQQGHPRFSSLS